MLTVTETTRRLKDDLHHLVEQLDEAAADELVDYSRWLSTSAMSVRMSRPFVGYD